MLHKNALITNKYSLKLILKSRSYFFCMFSLSVNTANTYTNTMQSNFFFFILYPLQFFPLSRSLLRSVKKMAINISHTCWSNSRIHKRKRTKKKSSPHRKSKFSLSMETQCIKIVCPTFQTNEFCRIRLL